MKHSSTTAHGTDLANHFELTRQAFRDALRDDQTNHRPPLQGGSAEPGRGEIVKALVVLRPEYEPSNNLVTELQAHVKAATAPYKYPREIEFVADLPKTASGKIRRVELRERERSLTPDGATAIDELAAASAQQEARIEAPRRPDEAQRIEAEPRAEGARSAGVAPLIVWVFRRICEWIRRRSVTTWGRIGRVSMALPPFP